jgi:hypothetical protein
MWYLKRWVFTQVLLMEYSKLTNKKVIKGKALTAQIISGRHIKKKEFTKIYSFYMLRNFKLEKRAKTTLGIHKKQYYFIF